DGAHRATRDHNVSPCSRRRLSHASRPLPAWLDRSLVVRDSFFIAFRARRPAMIGTAEAPQDIQAQPLTFTGAAKAHALSEPNSKTQQVASRKKKALARRSCSSSEAPSFRPHNKTLPPIP